MNEVTLIVEILKAHEHLLCDDLDERTGHTLFLVSLNQGKEIFTERLKNDADVGRFGALVGEGIEKGDYVCASRMIGGNR